MTDPKISSPGAGEPSTPTLETLTRRIVTEVIQARSAGEADNIVREILWPILRDRDVVRFDHATAIHAMEREREYRKILWAAAVTVWPEPLRVSPLSLAAYDPSCEIQKRYQASTDDALFYGVPAQSDEQPPSTNAADRSADHPSCDCAPRLYPSPPSIPEAGARPEPPNMKKS